MESAHPSHGCPLCTAVKYGLVFGLGIIIGLILAFWFGA